MSERRQRIKYLAPQSLRQGSAALASSIGYPFNEKAVRELELAALECDGAAGCAMGAVLRFYTCLLSLRGGRRFFAETEFLAESLGC